MANTFDIKEINLGEIEAFGNKGAINENKRVLLIGLGGTGTDTLLITKDTIMNRFKLKDGKVPGNIEFLAIDTDESILGKRSGAATIPKNDFALLDDPMIANNLNNKSKLPEHFKDWVNPALTAPQGAGNKGAGAIRQIGRYLLMSNYSKVLGAIESKIQKIMVAAPGGSLIDIIILSGISGGTGSGTFIDMGYIVRKACQNLVIGNLQKQITAYLFLPDANQFNPRVPASSKKFIQVNGYAALKDLDYFMSIPEKKRVSADESAKKTYMFRQKYTSKDVIESDEAPFDSTYLVSGQSDVLHPQQNAYTYAINITADSIVNFIAGNMAKGHTGVETAGVESVDINGAAMKAQNPHFIKYDGKKQLGIYDYKIIGASMASLPVKDITDYIAGMLLEKINILKNQLPTQKDYDKFYRTVGLNAIEQNVLQKAGTISPGITGQDLKASPDSDGIMMQNLNKQVNNAISNAKTLAEAEIAALESKIIREVDSYFTDINKGPFFANRIMADRDNGVIARLRFAAGGLQRRTNDCTAEATKIKNAALAQKQDANMATFGKVKKYDDYINLRLRQSENVLRSEVCKTLADKINGGSAIGGESNLVDKIYNKNRSLYDTYTLILDTLAKKFSKNGTVVSSKKGGRTFVWDIVSLKDIEPTIKASINQQMLDDQMNSLLTNMIKESEKWCNDKNALHQFGNFISDGFQAVLSISMDSYLQNIPETKLLNMVATLDREAQEHFPNNIAVTSGAANIYNQVTVPQDAPKMKQLVENYLQNKGVLTPPQQSLLCERISWIRVSIGVPLFRYAYLPTDEGAYINMNPTHKAGLHLYENKGVCGWDYPALLPEVFYEQGYENPGEKERHNKLATLFDKAERFRLVRYEHSAASIKVSDEDWCAERAKKILMKYKIDKSNIYGTVESLTQIMECRKELGEIADDINAYDGFKYIYIPESAEELKHEDTVAYARESFTRMPEAVKPVKDEIEKIEGINALIKELDDISEAFTNEKDKYMTFIYAFIFGVIKRKGAKYVYSDGEEETEMVNTFNTPLWRFEIYKLFDENLRTLEESNVNEMLSRAADSDEELARIKKELDDILRSVTVTESAKLETVNQNDTQYSAANEFYNKLKVFINDEIQKYIGMGI